MTYDELENRMTVEAGEAFVTWGDVGDDPDLVDYNEMASAEANAIHEDAFGQSFGCYNDSIGQSGNNDTLYNNLWLNIQRMWKFPNDDERIFVPVVIDGDDTDIYTTVRKLDEAVCDYARQNVHLTDEQRKQLVAQLRNDYPERIAND